MTRGISLSSAHPSADQPAVSDGGPVLAGNLAIVSGPVRVKWECEAAMTPLRQQLFLRTSAERPGGAANVYHSPYYNIDARGAQVGVAEQISSAIQSHQAYIERNLLHMINTSAKRYG